MATAEERTAQTSGEGRYTFSQLQPGSWELTAESWGFRSFIQRSIILTASQTASLNITMQLGEVSQSVEVATVSLQLEGGPETRARALDGTVH